MGNLAFKTKTEVITLPSTSPPTLFLYLDYLQFPINGILIITSNSVINRGTLSGSKTVIDFSEEIIASDFSAVNRILALGFKDGTTKILSCNKLIAIHEFTNDSPVSALDCSIPSKLIVGYQNGVVKEFTLPNTVPTRIFSPPPNTSVVQTRILNNGDLILIAYNEAERGIINGYVNGTPVYSTAFSNTTILDMSVSEEKKLLILLLGLPNTFCIFDYIEGKMLSSMNFSIPDLGANLIVMSFNLIPITPKLLKAYNSSKEMEGDIVVMATTEGDLLTGIITMETKEEEKKCNMVLKGVYKAHPTDNIKITAFYVDLVTDKTLVASEDNTIRIIENSIMKIINPETEVKEEKKGWFSKWKLPDFGEDSGVLPIMYIGKREQLEDKTPVGASTFSVIPFNSEEGVHKVDEKRELPLKLKENELK